MNLSLSIIGVFAIGLNGCDGRTDNAGSNFAKGGGSGAAGAGGSTPDVQLHRDRCAAAEALHFEDGVAAFTADTSSGSDEFPHLECDSKHVALGGLSAPQFYYRLPLENGERIRVDFQPSFYGFVYLFSANTPCSESAINDACSSKGAAGDISPIVNPGTSVTFFFDPNFTGPGVLAVDSDTSGGKFVLSVSYVQD